MTQPPPTGAATAGLELVATIVFGFLAGLGIGALVGAAVPVAFVGLIAGAIGGILLVRRRFERL
jgi:uncharacterized membrane protein